MKSARYWHAPEILLILSFICDRFKKQKKKETISAYLSFKCVANCMNKVLVPLPAKKWLRVLANS